MRKDVWTREQLIVALNLYWQIPYNKISGSSNDVIKHVSTLIGRTPAALAYKLMNFTSLDPERQGKGNKGKSSAGAGDKIIWDEYFNQWENLANDSITILSKTQHKPIEQIIDVDEVYQFAEGKEKERLIKIRVNQSNFRQRILASYNEKCCITGLNIPSLLVASHIIPWAVNKVERLNPRNGLCLNSIHDKAFDRGFITLTSDYKVQLSKDVLMRKKDNSIKDLFLKYENQTIILPDRYLPNPDFLEWHYQNVFTK
ncbi:MAG: HNH endonuclease [Saprospiraceae bacterium]|nr:HNH endonuclease [Saprospiraceae bacterium]